MRTSLEHGNRLHELVFEEPVVHLEGEFYGNIDLTVTFAPPVSKRDLLSSLWLQVPGESVLLDVVGYLQNQGEWDLTYCSEYIRDTSAVPAAIEAYWGAGKEIFLGSVPCRQASEADVEPVVLKPELVYGKAAVRRS